MASAFRWPARGFGVLFIAFWTALGAAGGAAWAQSDPNFGGRYVSADGSIGVELDRSGDPPLLRFDDSPEILVLSARPATRGDVMLRDESGLPVLRVTPFGGATLFRSDTPRGVPLIRKGAAASFFAPPPAAEGIPEEADQTRALFEALYGQSVALDLPAPGARGGQSRNLLAAVQNLRIALTVLGDNSAARSAVRTRLDAVRFVPREGPSVALTGRVLELGFEPDGGPAGRPSSASLVRFLEDAL